MPRENGKDCKRFPPAFHFTNEGMSSFPIAHCDGTCGEWRPYTDERQFIMSEDEIEIIEAYRKVVGV